MSKRFIGVVLVCIMVFNFLFTLTPMSNVYAFDNFQVEVIKDNAQLREGYYESKDVIKRYSKGTILTVVGEKKNLWGNLWYKIKDGGYIYSENVKKITKKHEHSYKLVKYESAHPHYANYECSCGSGYCGTDTKKVDGCNQCYSHKHSYKLVRYESAHPHYANYECSCGSGYCGTDTKKVDGCSQCYPHKHSYKLVRYESAHPHYANYECSCGSGYCGTDTKKVDGCSQCYPHEHSYKLVRYESAHPHYANYECSCGSGYCGTDTKKVDGCSQCYPHEHSYELVEYEDEHPHYAIYECSCGSGYCGTKTRKVKSCEECFPEEEEEHEHSYELTGYEDAHPHYAMYECSCGSGYCGTKTKKQKNCDECYPDEYEDDEELYGHFCYYTDRGTRRMMHPHYVVEECTVCGNQRENRGQTETFLNCLECINEGKYNNFNSPFKFNMYEINSGQYVYFEVSEIVSDDDDVAGELHTMLDICGFAAPEPFAMVCDGINVVYYLVERDYVNASISSTSFIPIAGIISSSGKLYKKAGTFIVDTAASSTDDVIKATTKFVIKNEDLLSDSAGKIVKNYSNYSDDVLETIEKISDNQPIKLKDAYYDNNILIDRSYTGTITSPAGIKYRAGSAEGHRLYHITERHGVKLQGKPNHGTLFNVDDAELFELIDEVYIEGRVARNPVLQDNGNFNVVYHASKEVGLKGERKIEMIFNGDELITAYPVK